jgi:lipopolysaccharide export system protein LptC
VAAPELYSRFVTVLKVGLPLVALGMLSALFLIQNDDGLESTISFSQGDIDELGDGLRVTNPTLTGSTRSEDRFRFTAEVVVPDAAPPTRATLTGLDGRIEFTDGRVVDIAARSGEIDLDAQGLALNDAVRIGTSDGLEVTSDDVSVDLRLGVLEARGGVVTEGPMGRIDSDTLRIEPSDGVAEARLITFGNGVRLVYDPVSRPD